MENVYTGCHVIDEENLLKRYNEIIKLAESVYDVVLHHVHVSIDLRGKAIGKAQLKNMQLYVKFNKNAFDTAEAFNHMYWDTVPHEIAHLISWVKPKTGIKNHNKYWKISCIRLGGTGEARYSSKKVGNVSSYKTTRKVGKKYEYNVNGVTIQSGPIQHKRIQSGVSGYRYGRTIITPEMFTGGYYG